jgi:hypothetical protein
VAAAHRELSDRQLEREEEEEEEEVRSFFLPRNMIDLTAPLLKLDPTPPPLPSANIVNLLADARRKTKRERLPTANCLLSVAC